MLQTVVQPYIEKGYEVIVIGDFNDWDTKLSLDTNNNQPISQTLSILKGDGTSWKLTNVAHKMPKETRFSEW